MMLPPSPGENLADRWSSASKPTVPGNPAHSAAEIAPANRFETQYQKYFELPVRRMPDASSIVMMFNMNGYVWTSISGLALYVVVWAIYQRQHRIENKRSKQREARGSCNIMLEQSNEKEFHSALEGTSTRVVLNIADDETGSQPVAVERVTGTLHGRDGTFLLRHSGITDEGPSFSVVPGSGTGDLIGLSGTMTIRTEDGAHSYDLKYTLDAENPRPAVLGHSPYSAPDNQQGDFGHILRSEAPLPMLQQ